MKNKKIKPVNFSARKQEIFERRNEILAGGQSSMIEAYKMLLEVDPDLTKTIELNATLSDQHEKS